MTALKTPISPPADTAQSSAELVKDSNIQGFMADVMEASMTVPVLVDFWAPWCGPCKQLTPLLEKIVLAAQGSVRLVKINIDENQQLAAQMRIQSVPAVFAFFQGRPVDGFMGALPESQLRQFIDRVAKLAGGAVPEDQIALALSEAEQILASGEADTALGIYQEILSLEPENKAAILGAGRALLMLNETAALSGFLASLPPALQAAAELEPLRSGLALAERSKAAGPLEDLAALVKAEPKNQSAKIDYATALFAGGQKAEAVEVLLASIQQDRQWNEGAARKELVKLFDILGPQDALTLDARKRLSSILFS